MPRRNKRKRNFRRRKLPLFQSLYPKQTLAKLKYVEEVTIDATTLLAAHVFRANGLYDPSVTSVGHQPLNFDQMMARFDHFRVVGSKITVQFAENANNTPAYCTVHLTDNGTSYSSYSNVNHLFESSQTKIGIVGMIYDNDANMGKITQTFSANKFFGRDRAQQSTMVGSASADPTEQAYYEVICAPINGVDPSAQNLLCTIEYTAIFSEPNIITQS